MGQFLSFDPLLMPDQHQSLNGYSYATNNPTTSVIRPAGWQAVVETTGGPGLRE
jgi:hypothetical protein